MAPSSMDLRQRVVRARESGLSSKEVAAKYEVSLAWVNPGLQRQRDTGPLGPRKQRIGGNRSWPRTPTRLRALVLAQPDRTLERVRPRYLEVGSKRFPEACSAPLASSGRPLRCGSLTTKSTKYTKVSGNSFSDLRALRVLLRGEYIRAFLPHRPGNGSAPASSLKSSTTLASRGSSRITFVNVSAISGDGASPATSRSFQ